MSDKCKPGVVWLCRDWIGISLTDVRPERAGLSDGPRWESPSRGIISGLLCLHIFGDIPKPDTARLVDVMGEKERFRFDGHHSEFRCRVVETINLKEVNE